MKIRISDNSIRLRLDRSEVEQIGASQAVTCATHFTDGEVFQYKLSVSDGAEVQASFIAGCIEVELPVSTARQWAASDSEISIIASQALHTGTLQLLVEKDFECLDPRDGEDQSNRFRNPKATI